MDMILSGGALAGLLGLFAYVVVSDVKWRRIPNGVNLGVALLAVPYWAGQDLSLLAVAGHQALVFGAALLLFGFLWLRGWLGGGDFKLYAALALWLPVLAYVEMLVWMSLAGGVLSLLVWADHRRRRLAGQPTVPYGVAIVCGSVAVLSEQIVKQFQP